MHPTLVVLALGLGPATEIPSDVTPGYPEASVPWIDHEGIHITTTTGAAFELSTTPAIVDAVYDYQTGEFETVNVCPIPEAFAGLSGAIASYHDTVLVVAPEVGLIEIDPVSCAYEVVATGFLPPVEVDEGVWAWGLPNDVIADWQGNVYVSDSAFGALYRWDGESDTLEVIAQAPEMGQVDPDCEMPEALAGMPFFGINGLRLSRSGDEILFLHTLPHGYLYSYDLDDGSVTELADFGCGSAPDELQLYVNGDALISMAFDVVLGDDFSVESLGSLARVDTDTGEVLDTISGPFEFSNGVTRTFGGPASIHCLQWPLSNHCVVANHYADQVGQPFEALWFRFDQRTWPEARPW